jgi:hypothetical protein
MTLAQAEADFILQGLPNVVHDRRHVTDGDLE